MPRWCCDVVPLIRKWGESGMQLSWRHLSLPLLPLMRWWSGLMMTVALNSKFHFLEIRLFSNEALYVHICKSSRLAMGMVNNKPGRSPRFNYCAGGGGGSGQNLLYGDWSGGRWAQWLPYSWNLADNAFRGNTVRLAANKQKWQMSWNIFKSTLN